MCISVQALETSIKHGQAALWVVSAWADNGSVPGATLHLSASPSGQVAQFSFGCSGDGSAACSIGTVTSGSAPRQVEARIAVPATATSVNSIRLTASATAPNLTKTPSVGAPVTVASGVSTTTPVYTSVPPSLGNIGTPAGAGGGGGGTTVSQLPVGSFPSVGVPGTSVSPGGNASGLFPAISPSGVTPGGSSTPADGEAAPAANTEALPIGTPVVDAQLVGLAALGVAFLLAVTRLSVRRRPAAAMAGAKGASMALAAPAALATAVPPAPADAQPAGSAVAPVAEGTEAGPEAPAKVAFQEPSNARLTEAELAAAGATMPNLLSADKADTSPDIPAVRDEPPTRPEPSVTGEDDGD
ncbi:MAG TPA: hypothetical protein VH478_13305 [Trebonia sp.]|nr:hypothetical protein [Trebonia sp.]